MSKPFVRIDGEEERAVHILEDEGEDRVIIQAISKGKTVLSVEVLGLDAFRTSMAAIYAVPEASVTAADGDSPQSKDERVVV